ncbi:MBOAT, membrane-bound O-acyltransferase family-domain-containing protein [Multifurca ochricompacta]|uniref:MBOAT, membrane-bound O-acyltransferase family-domain-containing protein n=1 Tax=Multifurca ochricompacta TaxID=376703 RepID=A0AAD4LZ07_9AGAM|nr:MBOAT, membrane-bound O-acyltransferase family-domain-containing protein [Multifurca ochricompacta]
MPPSPLSHLEVITGGNDPDKLQRRGGIVRLTVDVPSASAHPPGETSHSRWRSFEFLLYYAIFLVTVPWMVYVPVQLSSKTHPNYSLYHHRLAKGWLPGSEIDTSDAQYRSFRFNLPALGALITAFFILKYAYMRPITNGSVPANNLYRLPFYLLFSVLMLTILHGSSILKLLFILSVNYALTKATGGTRLAVPVTWLFNSGVLFLNERYEGYAFGSLHPGFAFLDEWRGVYPRWHVSFNITMLRLVSFSIDYHWARGRIGIADPGNAVSDKKRAAVFHPPATYTFRNYLAYALYAPLYIAGPIITFNDFMWQLARPKDIAPRVTARYALRFLIALLTMEILIHAMHVVAIKDAHAWSGMTPAQLSMVGFWNLIFVWLKLLLPWRFFRLWALADGLDPPENMVRCMANNYSPLGFWRAWHRSYNLWIVRYLYIPLGGTRRLAATSVLIFTFVALWHDLSPRLLAWGWLAALFILPEQGAKYIFFVAQFGDRWWYRHACAIGGVFNVLLMMGANLVGFVLGLDGAQYFARELINSWGGISFLLVACACLFVGVQLMFEYRAEELRRGIQRRC